MTEGNLFLSAASASAQSGATSMGKGAWDCDSRKAIPPEKEVREKNTRKRGEEEAVEREGRKNKKNRRSKKKLEQAEVFEEIPTMDFPFHGIPTVPPRKDMMHLVSGKKRERERKNREKERQREREQRTTHSKREGGKNAFSFQTFFCRGCRYRVTAEPSWTSAAVKRALWAGGISRSNREDGRGSTPGMKKWEDLVRRKEKKAKGKSLFCSQPSVMTRKREKTLTRNPEKKLSFASFADPNLRRTDSGERQDAGLVRGASGERTGRGRERE